MTMLEAVIFDFDGVLCDYRFADRLQHLSELSGLAPDVIEARIWGSGFEDEADEGRYDLDTYCRLTCEKLETELSYAELLAARVDATRPKNDVLDIVRALEGQVKRAMLTNNGPFLAEGIRQILPDLDTLFGPHAYFSGILGLAKPNPAAFLAITKRLYVAPARTLFVDDSNDYIAGAEEAGLISHHFQSADGLQAKLRALGVTV